MKTSKNNEERKPFTSKMRIDHFASTYKNSKFLKIGEFKSRKF